MGTLVSHNQWVLDFLNDFDNLLDAITHPITHKGRKRMKEKIEALTGIGQKARSITTEIGGNYAICVSVEKASKKKFLCVYQSGKGLSFEKGAVHNRTLVKAFAYTNEDGYVAAYKSALKYIAVLEDKICI